MPISIDPSINQDPPFIATNSERLQGSTKTEVQDHVPKAHTHSVGFTIAIPIDTPESTGTDKGVFPFAPGVDGTIEEIYLMAKTAPGTDKTLTVDVNKGGTTIFTTQENRPSISGTDKTGTSGAPDVTTFAKNDLFTIDVDVSTATTAVADAILLIRGKQKVA